MNSQAALAVFVKTPGLSPIKTRLADKLGLHLAEEFFQLSVAAVEATVATVAELGDIRPYWAVAEEAGLAHPRWQRFPRIHQGTGGLGQRLGRVFAQLQRRHNVVVAIGADSPQITPKSIEDAIRNLGLGRVGDAHALGRCHDGGFYLIGTNRRLPPAIWQGVPYSTSEAADRLAANLAKHGRIHELAALSDVDQLHDLAPLREELGAVPDLSAEQRAVLNWVTSTIEGNV